MALGKVIDCFVFFDELDLLEVRLNELKDVVDIFILTESPYTFTGIKKPLYFQENKERFANFNIVAETYNPITTVYRPQDYELNQKQYNLDYAYTNYFTNGDTIVHSDCDEIPKASVLKDAVKENSSGLKLDSFYYYMNCRQTTQMRGWAIRTVKPKQQINCDIKQRYKVDKVFDNAGWHFSFLGDIKSKLSAWGHAGEYDKPPYNTLDHIKNCKESGMDLFMRSGKRKVEFEFVKNLDCLPEYVKSNMDKFKKYIK